LKLTIVYTILIRSSVSKYSSSRECWRTHLEKRRDRISSAVSGGSLASPEPEAS
jgi:hypothetical protein